jgi:choline dehydrogenase
MPNTEPLGTFDYIVLGAGSAGCVVASRLSEDPKVTVALIEAGGDTNTLMVKMPAGLGELIVPNKFNWAFETDIEPTAANRKLYWPRGRGLGGSSAINAMIYIRGHKSDYDNWASMGLSGWDFDGVLPYFKKSEDNQTLNGAFHGKGGPLTISDASSNHPIHKAFVEAGVQAGYPLSKDFNGEQYEGVGLYQFTIRNRERCSTAVAFLSPEVRKRKNLSIITMAQTEKVTFSNKRASGVVIRRNDRQETLAATREVILCAGAVGSPQILMLSGVGPVDHLKTMGIDVVADRRDVGQNMQDHPDYFLQYECTQPVTYHTFANPLNMVGAGLQYIFTKSGPCASVPVESGGFIRSADHIEVPDIQLQILPRLMNDHGRQPIEGGQRHGYLAHVTHLRPEGRGSISLASPDPLAAPRIHANYLSTEEDRRAMRDGVRRTRTIFAQKAFDPYRGPEVWPGEAAQSDAELDKHIAEHIETDYHCTSTCRMGVDEHAVVDGSGRVLGVTGLRVADASIMPKIVSGNTNAPTIMIGEKIAAMIMAGA